MTETISEAQQGMAKAILTPLLPALAGETESGMVAGRDVLDVLAFAIAAMIEYDDSLTANSHFREAGQQVAKRIEGYVRELRDRRMATGESFLADVIDHAVAVPERTH